MLSIRSACHETNRKINTKKNFFVAKIAKEIIGETCCQLQRRAKDKHLLWSSLVDRQANGSLPPTNKTDSGP